MHAFVFPKLPVVKHYRLKAATDGSQTVCADLIAAGIEMEELDKEHEREVRNVFN